MSAQLEAVPAPRQIDCHNPATGERLGQVTAAGPAKVAQVVREAREAQKAFAQSGFAVRRRVLKRLRTALIEQADALCELICQVSGKTREHALVGEIWPMCEKLTWTLKHGEQHLKPEKVSSGLLVHKSARLEYQPLGVVGAIIPWNYPLLNILNGTIPALMAGNAVVVKPSEQCSWASDRVRTLVHAALEAEGLSRALFEIVDGYGDTGKALIESGIDGLLFIGSPHNGRKVLEAAAKQVIPVVLELGGKDPFIVCEDADLERAAHAAMIGVFINCGQNCVAAERILVHEKIAPAFERRISELVGKLRQGAPGIDKLVDVGSMANAMQLGVVEALVAKAVTEGARVVSGAERAAGPGLFFKPTVLADVTPKMTIMQEETFGPVMLLTSFRDDDEAIRIANQSPYSLGASVFSADASRARKIAAQVKSGMSAVNDFGGMTFMAPALTFGGVGESGFGRLNGRDGLRACCNVKAVLEDRWPLSVTARAFPVDAASYERTRKSLRWLYSGWSDFLRTLLGR
jgi:acyl-CoA reductase-like NAD-dependent aldehyde dehydrogenase